MGKLEVDKELIRELATLLDETGLTEIEVSDDENRLRVARGAGVVAATAPTAPLAAAPAPDNPGPAPASEPVYDESHPGAVTSPMVGTVYRSPEPTAPAYVNVGDLVSEGQTVAIIEAMKTFNEILANRGGTVKAILFDNQSPVEFGDVLLIIE